MFKLQPFQCLVTDSFIPGSHWCKFSARRRQSYSYDSAPWFLHPSCFSDRLCSRLVISENGSVFQPKRRPLASLTVRQIQQDAPACSLCPSQSDQQQCRGHGSPAKAAPPAAALCQRHCLCVFVVMADVKNAFVRLVCTFAGGSCGSWTPVPVSFGRANRRGGSKLGRRRSISKT